MLSISRSDLPEITDHSIRTSRRPIDSPPQAAFHRMLHPLRPATYGTAELDALAVRFSLPIRRPEIIALTRRPLDT